MSQRGSQVLSTLAALVIVVAGLRAAADIVNPFLLACFVAVMVAPLMTWCVRRGLPRGAALTIVLAVLVAAAGLLGRVLGASVARFQSQIPFYEERLQGDLTTILDGLEVWLGEFGLFGDDPDDPDDGGDGSDGEGSAGDELLAAGSDEGVLDDPESEAGDTTGDGGVAAPGAGAGAPAVAAGDPAPITAEPGTEDTASTVAGPGGPSGDAAPPAREPPSLRQLLRRNLLQILDPSAVFGVLRNLLGALGAMLGNGLVILLIIAFLLAEGSSFPRKLRVISREPEAALARWRSVGDDINRYMGIKTGTSLVTGVVVALWLMIVGVDFPLLWGTLAFLLNYIPNLGSVLAALPAVMLAFVQLGAGGAGLTILGFGVTNFVVGSILEPRFMGRGLGLSTLVVFLSLVFWGWVLGPVGMLLSVPLTMAVKIVLEAADDTRWIGVLLGSEKALLARILQDEPVTIGARATQATPADVLPAGAAERVDDGGPAGAVAGEARSPRAPAGDAGRADDAGSAGGADDAGAQGSGAADGSPAREPSSGKRHKRSKRGRRRKR